MLNISPPASGLSAISLDTANVTKQRQEALDGRVSKAVLPKTSHLNLIGPPALTTNLQDTGRMEEQVVPHHGAAGSPSQTVGNTTGQMTWVLQSIPLPQSFYYSVHTNMCTQGKLPRLSVPRFSCFSMGVTTSPTSHTQTYANTHTHMYIHVHIFVCVLHRELIICIIKRFEFYQMTIICGSYLCYDSNKSLEMIYNIMRSWTYEQSR